MKRMLHIIGWIFVGGMLILAYLFVSQYFVSEDDFVKKEGIISDEIVLTKDEYATSNTSLKLQIENETVVYSLPGKMLNIADSTIYNLKKGDKIELIIKKRTKENRIEDLMNKNKRIWGIGKVNQEPLLRLKETMEYTKHPRSLIYACMFLIMTGVVIFYLLRK